MPKLLDIRDINMVHKTLMCLKDVETEFGMFCGGAHAMILSLLKDYIDKETTCSLDRKSFSICCAIADNLYDWFESFKRSQEIEAEALKANHRIGAQMMRAIHGVRGRERSEDGEEDDE